MKFGISPLNRTKDSMEEHILEFIWRRKHQANLWNGLIRALAAIHYD